MKVAFIFDTVLLKDENNDYYAINLNYRLWKDRYLKVFDSMVVSTRVKELSHKEILNKKGYTLSNGRNVEISPISEYNQFPDIFFHRKKIIKQVKDIIEQVDCVIIRLPSPLGNLVCDICRKVHKKYAIEVVACAYDTYKNHGHWAGRIIAPYMHFATKKQCKKAEYALYVTEYFLQKHYPTKGLTINASNVMIHESNDEVLEKRLKKISANEKVFTLGLVGSLEWKLKGHKVALKALKKLISKYPEIRIEFLGNGDATYLKRIVAKMKLGSHVLFKGTLPGGEAVLNWMDTLDLLVIPSFIEGLPRVLIEAMSRACPAVGSNVGGIPELISNEVQHKKGNYMKLTNDIERVFKDKEFSKKLAIENFYNAKKYAMENLDLKRQTFWENFRDSKK